MASKPSRADEYIKQFNREVGNILMSLRNLIRKALPEASEYVEKDMLAYALGPNTYRASVCVISGHKAHATLIFSRGNKLSDPGKLLQGRGKTARNIKIMSEDDIPTKAVSEWVKQSTQIVSGS